MSQKTILAIIFLMLFSALTYGQYDPNKYIGKQGTNTISFKLKFSRKVLPKSGNELLALDYLVLAQRTNSTQESTK